MRLLSEVRERLRALVFRAREEREMEAEIRFHLDMEAERLVREQGLSREEAHRRAAVAFGGEERFKEQVRDARGVRWIDELVQDVRYALRSLRRARGFTLVVVVTLALGIGATTTLFAIVNAVLLRPLPYPNPDRIVSISEAQDGKDGEVVAVPDFYQWARSSRSFDALAMYGGTSRVVGERGDRSRVDGERVSWQFFRVFGTSPVLGRTFSPQEDIPDGPDVVVLGHDLWERRFGGDPAVVGRTISMDDHPYTVLGIMPAGFAAPRKAQFWLPMQMDPAPSDGSTFFAQVVGRLGRGIQVQGARAELAAVVARRVGSVVPGAEPGHIEPVVMTLHGRMFGSTRPALLLLLGAVGFLLLIACANVANLLLARASSRWHELAVRGALGAPRWRLARQLVWESVVVSLLGGGIGLLIPVASVAFFVRLSPASVAHVTDVHVDGTVLAFTAAVSILTGLVFGLVPALSATRPAALESLSEGRTRTTATASQHLLRRVLVVGELATALALLTGAGLLTRSFVQAMAVDVGFEPDHALQVTVDLTRSAYPTDTAALTFFKDLAHRLRALPGVTAVGYASTLPTLYMMTIRVPIPSTQVPSPPISVAGVSPGFMTAFGSEVVEGRGIDSRDQAGTEPVVVLSERAVRALFPDGAAVGRRLGVPGHGTGARTVVGVVKDIQERGSDTPRLPQLYEPLTQVSDVPYAVAVRFTGSATPLLATIRRMGAAFDPMEAVVSVSTMNDEMDQLVAPRRFDSVVIDLFTGLALVLAAVGLYGVMAYQVTQRTRELGVRMALGADHARVLQHVLREGMALAILGTLCGTALTLGLSRFLDAMLFNVSARDPITFAAAPAVMMLIALLACYVPARRATEVDPMAALRHE